MLTPALQLAISLAFVYLLLSALCSAIQEVIANLAKWRANTLETAIENMLGDTKLKDEIYNHALVKSIWRPSWLIAKVNAIHKPAYISSAMFAQVLQDVKAVKGVTNLPAPAQKVLNTVLQGAQSAQEERQKIEHWFDDAMDAVSGWYKRKANAWMWGIAAVVCLALNVDSINIGKVLWDDPTARAAVNDAAKAYVAKKTSPTPSSSAGTASAPSATAGTPANTPNPPQDAQQLQKELQDKLNAVAQARSDLNTISIPLGWCKAGASDCPEQRQFSEGIGLVWKLLGLLVSVLAVSQGAPFWFDLLQKFVNLRLAGDPPPDSRPGK